MPEKQTLTQRVVHRVRWAKHEKAKAMIRREYVFVREPLIAAEYSRVLKRMS